MWHVCRCLPVGSILLSSILLGISCSKSTTLYPVTGKVLYKGQPLSGAVVAFHLEGQKDLKTDPSIGNSSSDGTFSLKTGDAAGAPAGKYAVTIICPEPNKAKGQGMGFATEFDTQDRL